MRLRRQLRLKPRSSSVRLRRQRSRQQSRQQGRQRQLPPLHEGRAAGNTYATILVLGCSFGSPCFIVSVLCGLPPSLRMLHTVVFLCSTEALLFLSCPCSFPVPIPFMFFL